MIETDNGVENGKEILDHIGRRLSRIQKKYYGFCGAFKMVFYGMEKRDLERLGNCYESLRSMRMLPHLRTNEYFCSEIKRMEEEIISSTARPDSTSIRLLY